MTVGRKGKGQRRSRSEWRSLLARFDGSGIGVKAYCRREGISGASFYRWRSMLSEEVDRGGVVVRDSAPGFVDLGALNLASSPRRRLDLKLDLGDGLLLHLVRS
ncbi:MAG: IS66 family insertion sequence element accessory protein TnpB [Tepidisphaeraceae bacterium]